MAFNDTFERLERLAHMIQRKSTGSPEQLAEKLGVSVRTVANLLDQLRNWGAEIEYCRERCSYCYTHPIELSFTIIKCPEKSSKIKGGQKKIIDFLFDADFLRWRGASL